MAAATPALPVPRGDGPYRLGLVCLGNICRSPVAQVVLVDALAEAGLADRVRVTSSGTGAWHVGESMDERAAATLRAAGYDPSRHRAHRVDSRWLDDHDLLLAMDGRNRADLTDLAPDAAAAGRLLLFRAFDPEGGPDAEVPDPWFGGPDGFDEVLAMVRRTSTRLTETLASLP